MDEQELMALLPTEPPEDWLSWLRQNGQLCRNYLIYRHDRGQIARARCTACREEMKLDWIRPEQAGCSRGIWMPRKEVQVSGSAAASGEKVRCPRCGEMVMAVHKPEMYGWCQEVIFFLTIEGRPGGQAVLTGWQARRYVGTDLEMKEECIPWEAYLFFREMDRRGKSRLKCRKAMAHRQLFYNAYPSEWRMPKRTTDSWGSCEWVHPWKSLEGTVLENAKAREYLARTKGGNLIGYLLEYKKHPAAENLVTGGFAQLLEEYITGGYEGMEPAAINWKEAKPLRMLGLEKWEAEHWRNNRGTIGLSGLVAYRKVKTALGRPVRPEEWEVIWHWPLSLTAELLQRENGRNYLRDLRYLIKQEAKNPNIRPGDMADYLRAAGELGEDLKQADVRWPKDLARADERAGERLAEKKNAQLAEAFADMNRQIEELAWEDGGLLIRPAANSGELQREGKCLHHCVGGYSRAHCEGKPIFFIRRAEEPEKPFFTLQLNAETGKVLQNRGLRNCARTQEVQEFEERWLHQVVEPWMKQKRKRPKKGKAA